MGQVLTDKTWPEEEAVLIANIASLVALMLTVKNGISNCFQFN